MSELEITAESTRPATTSDTVRVAVVDRRIHWIVLGLSVSVLLAALVLEIRDHEQVVIPLVQVPLPGTCTYKRLLNADCPGCGLTRCFISVAHGRWSDGWRFNPAGILLFSLVVVQIPYRVVQITRSRRGQQELRLGKFSTWMLFAVILALLVQWVVRMF